MRLRLCGAKPAILGAQAATLIRQEPRTASPYTVAICLAAACRFAVQSVPLVALQCIEAGLEALLCHTATRPD